MSSQKFAVVFPLSIFRCIFLFLVFLCFFLPLSVHGHPQIGLVLSGGGARGGAHLGVIQVLEEKRIPIAGIVGTSMGALVGGLYAGGMGSDELYSLLTETKWDDYIAISYDRSLLPFRRKLLERDFPGQLKVGVDSANNIGVGTGLFKRQMMLQFLQKKTLPVAQINDFDQLEIPYRAVACNLENGDTVVLKSGSLAESIYASMSIPGGFEPITINDTILVDGGISDNLPVDVMRQEMDMDILIVVDISTPFDKDARFSNLLAVLGQLSNILMRKNVNDVILTLKDNEILISPDLTGYTPLDAHKYREIIKIGADTTAAEYEQKLTPYTLSAAEYEEYRRVHRSPPVYEPPVICALTLDNETFLHDETILRFLHHHEGQPLDADLLDEDLLAIYSLGLFDDVTYEIGQDAAGTTLNVSTLPSWDSNGQLKFAFGFEDDFSGTSDYLVRFEYVMFGLNSYAGEWRTRLTFGQEKLIFSELYQPLDLDHFFYLRPDIFYRNKQVYISPTIIGSHTIEADLDESVPASVTEYGATLGLGVNLNRTMQFEIGTVVKDVEPSISFIAVDTSGARFVNNTEHQKSVVAYAQLIIDSMSHPFFPNKGHGAELRWSRQMVEWGSEMDFSQASFRGQGAYSLGRHTLLPRVKYGKTFTAENFDSSQDLTTFYTLGGLFNLSGLPTNAVSGDHAAFGALLYRYSLSDSGFFGTLGMPLYSGFSLEAGETWYKEHGAEFRSDNIIYAGSIYLAADTFLGPFYLGLGLADEQYWSLYFSLGATF